MGGSDEKRRVVIRNKKARHDYEILEKLEAGIALLGTEVKSVREGRIQLKDSYVEVVDGELWLRNLSVTPYSHGGVFNHASDRPRRLLASV